MQQTIGNAPSGQQPIADSRFATHDIRLSSALCALGFSLRTDAQPVGRTINVETGKEVVVFYHQDKTTMGDFSARDVELWWNSPKGKYTIVGYDDALTAIQRVHAERARLLHLAFHGPKYTATQTAIFATTSINEASIVVACDIKLIGYDPSGKQWIFGKGASLIAGLVEKGGRPEDRPLSNDLCIDWMLAALQYRNWLAKFIKDPDNIPMLELRDGERTLMISKGMKESEKEQWINRF